MKISMIKGMIIGGVLYIFVSNLLSIPLVIEAINATRGNNSEYAVINYLKDNHVLFSIQILIDVVCSILSGYVAARIANEKELIIGALSSFLSVRFSVFHLVSGLYTALEVATIAEILIPPFFGLLGGYLRYTQTVNG